MLNTQMEKSGVVEGRAACAIQRKGRERRALCLALSADRWPPHDPHMEFTATGEVLKEGEEDLEKFCQATVTHTSLH